MPLEKELRYKQLQDPKFKELSSKLEREDHHKFEPLDGLILTKSRISLGLPCQTQ